MCMIDFGYMYMYKSEYKCWLYSIYVYAAPRHGVNPQVIIVISVSFQKSRRLTTGVPGWLIYVENHGTYSHTIIYWGSTPLNLKINMEHI